MGSARGQGYISVAAGKGLGQRTWAPGQAPLSLSCRKSRRPKGLAAPEDAHGCVLPGQDPAPTPVARVPLTRLALPASFWVPLISPTLLWDLGPHPNKELLVRVSLSPWIATLALHPSCWTPTPAAPLLHSQP